MAISKEDLANMALSLAGEKPIVRLTDRTDGAIAINTVYEQVERETFEMPENWSFCTTRKQLTEVADASGAVIPVSGWDHQYSLPSNTLRILGLVDVNGDKLPYRYRREVLLQVSGGRTTETDVLLVNEPFHGQITPYVRYLYYRQDPNKRPAWFNKLFYHDMALAIVKPISKEDPGRTTLERRRERAYQDALAANGMEDADVNEHGEDTDRGHNLLTEVNGRTGFRHKQRT